MAKKKRKKNNMPTLGFLIAWGIGNLDKYNGLPLLDRQDYLRMPEVKPLKKE